MCDCLTKFEMQMQGKYPDFRFQKEWVVIKKDENRKTDSFDPRPLLCATYHKEKKDGSVSGRLTTGPVLPSFCPFCGKAY